MKVHKKCGSPLIKCSASVFAESDCAKPPIRVAEGQFVCEKHCDEFGYTHKPKEGLLDDPKI